MGFYEEAMDALNKGANINDLIKMPVREAIGRFKYTHEDNIESDLTELIISYLLKCKCFK